MIDACEVRKRRSSSEFSLTKEKTVSVPPPARPQAILPPFTLGVCSWSLQVKNIPELVRLLDRLGTNVVQIACGDPHHASWDEGDLMPTAAARSGIVMTSAMLGFPGEDYTSPQTIKETGGFGDSALRAERLSRLEWAIDRTVALGLDSLTLHAGFLPDPDDPGRDAFLDTLAQAGRLAAARDVTLAFETGQETADRLRQHSTSWIPRA